MPASKESSTTTPDRSQQAQVYCHRALDYYQQGNHAAAVKTLGLALDLDRSLSDDPRIQRFAERLVGSPAGKAIDTLTDLKSREALAVQLGKRTSSRSSPLQSHPLWIIGTIFLALTFMGLIFLISSGQLSLNTFNPRASQGQVEQHHLEDDPQQEYFVAAPIGSVPDDGWQVVVAIHGIGQTGQDMVDILGDTSRSRGILLVAPTFPAIRDANLSDKFYETGRGALLRIINEVKRSGMTNPKRYNHYLGQVFLGYGEGGSLVTYTALHGLDYSDSGYAMEGPIGVVLVNSRAPLFDAPQYALPYLVLYGELAPQAAISRDYNKRLTNQGVETYLIQADGADTTMTPQQMRIMADFVQQVYYPPPAIVATATP